MVLFAASCALACVACEGEESTSESEASPAPAAEKSASDEPQIDPEVREALNLAKSAREKLTSMPAPENLVDARPHFQIFANMFRHEVAGRDMDAVRSHLATPKDLAGCRLKRQETPLSETFDERFASVLDDIGSTLDRGWGFLAVELGPERTVEVVDTDDDDALLQGEDCGAEFVGRFAFDVALDNSRPPHALHFTPRFFLIDGHWRYIDDHLNPKGYNCKREGDHQNTPGCLAWKKR